MTNTANVRLARPLSVPNAMPIFFCRDGVTSMCSSSSSPTNTAQPIHRNQCCGKYVTNHVRAATLTTCNPMLMPKAVLAVNFDGIECSPR